MKKTNFFKTLLLAGSVFLGQNAFSQGIYLKNFDKSVRPQDDFFKFVNGNWLKTNEIPASESNWGSFSELQEGNQDILRQILEDASKRKAQDKPKGSDLQLVSDFYTSGMNTTLINEKGIAPIKEEWDNINQIKTTEDIQKTIARHQTMSVGSIFGFYVGADSKNSKMNAVYISQGGTSLPDRSYYLEDNKKFAKTREEYKKHLKIMFELFGENAENAQKNADAVYKIENRIAETQRVRTDMRNPQKNYNKRSVEELQQMLFNLDMKKHFEYLGAKNVTEVIIGQPEYLAMADRMIKDFSIDHWKAYFKWKLMSATASSLTDKIEQENFRFFSTELNGVKEMKPRQKRIIQITDGALGQVLGKLYVEKTFPPQAKAKMMEMIDNIKEALAERIQGLDWMSEETKKQALIKLQAITPKIGYPDKWRDFSKVEIKSDDYVGNLMRLRKFGFEYNLAKIGQPVDKSEFGMTAPTVNAYYSPVNNEIAFPAGILQPPFFDFKADDAVNYGGIGAVIGHEITHGFDDQGSQYDAEGNLKMWWTKEDREKFEAKAQKIVEQYNEYKVLDSVAVNGKFTLGENIADLGGVTIAYQALQKHYKKVGKPKNKDGFTPEQRFFIGFAQVWRRKYRSESMIQRIKTDPHSPSEFRTNGTLSNLRIFHEAFGVKDGDKMKKKEIISIW